MDYKTSFTQGENVFTLVEPLTVAHKIFRNKLALKFELKQREYLKGIDFPAYDKYESRRVELTTAKIQVQELLDKGLDKDGYAYTDETRKKDEDRVKELNEKIDVVTKELEQDIEASEEAEMKSGLLLLAYNESCKDTKFIKPIFEKLLKGDTDKIDYDDNGFVLEVILNFFGLMKTIMKE